MARGTGCRPCRVRDRGRTAHGVREANAGMNSFIKTKAAHGVREANAGMNSFIKTKAAIFTMQAMLLWDFPFFSD